MPREYVFFRYWLPVFSWMAVIFFMSTGLGAGSNTSRIFAPFLEFLFFDIQAETIEGLQLMLRKVAHFGEYFVLACLLWRAMSRVKADSCAWSWIRAGQGFVICVAYAISDEFHQSFVAERVGTVGDVLIDSLGVVAGLATMWLWQRSRRCPPSAN